MKLVIVESPTKAKTLSRFLGDGYQIEASMGHIRDLPKSKLGVDVEKGFKPDYVVDESKEKYVRLLKKAAKGKEEIVLATDPDREGEAIAYHIKYLLKDGGKFSRIVFHEITKSAIIKALENPGKLNKKLVEAQQARRILDRLVGYKLSPVLWRKVRRGLSAGRVQSVAVRLIVEREKEVEAFKAEEYWQIKVRLKKDKEVVVELAKLEGKKAEIGDKAGADKVVGELKKAKYQVSEVKERLVKRYPLPPFMTSTMQRTAGYRFGWSAKKTMREAQQLYEKGLITYHRTDSVNMASQAVKQVRKYIVSQYGEEYLPEKAVGYKSKSRMAQGAHEAIRPTKVKRETVEMVQGAKRLYRLIWERFVGCQMKPAELDKTTVRVKAGEKYELKAEGERLKFAGWLKVNPKSYSFSGQELPELSQGDGLKLVKVLAEQKFTLPAARYTEASLIKVLEEKGIGRPSTYAPILSTIQARQYVEKKEKKLYPTPVGVTVVEFLIKYFSKVMDYEFTADMEEGLDEIARGNEEWNRLLKEFYVPFEKKVEEVIETAKRVKIAVEKTGDKCPDCKKGEVVIRVGRFGKFLSCGKFPECKYTATYKEVVEGVKCGDCKGEVVIKKSRKGRQFYGCGNYPKCKWASWSKPVPPKTASRGGPQS